MSAHSQGGYGGFNKSFIDCATRFKSVCNVEMLRVLNL